MNSWRKLNKMSHVWKWNLSAVEQVQQKNNGVERGGKVSRLWQQALAEECWHQGAQVHSSYLHHGAAGHRCRAWLLWSSAQLHWVVHHHVPLEQDRGGHERVALHTQTWVTSVRQLGCIYKKTLLPSITTCLTGSDGACPAVTIVRPGIVLLCPFNSSCWEPKAFTNYNLSFLTQLCVVCRDNRGWTEGWLLNEWDALNCRAWIFDCSAVKLRLGALNAILILFCEALRESKCTV